MSANSSSDLPTNEEIIDEITRDLKTKATVDLESETSTNVDNIPENFDNSDTEEPSNTQFDDLIDEERLKDIEVTLSEDERLERHSSALSYKTQGNEEFKKQNFTESIRLYTEALRICPLKFDGDRAVLYANRAASKTKLGRSESAIEDCSKAIELNNNYVKAYLRRAKLYEDSDKLEESLADYNKINELDPGNKDAVIAQARLPPLINEKNEKMKEEMLGKLKELGNTILKPFGLSTENFKLTQDPNTGGYSVNFTQGTK